MMNQIERSAALKIGMFGLALIAASALMGCGRDTTRTGMPPIAPEPGPRENDDAIVRGVAAFTISAEKENEFAKLFNSLLMPSAFAVSTASTVVTYNNAPSVQFTINVASFVAGSFTGDTLSLGSISISALKDNNLKVCNPGGNTKCTTAILRVYTTGATAGFVNTSDTPQYGVPVYTTGDNPTTAVPLLSPGVSLDTLSGMAASKHTVKLSDFTPTTFQVSADFANGGSGNYSMTYVVEYALAP